MGRGYLSFTVEQRRFLEVNWRQLGELSRIDTIETILLIVFICVYRKYSWLSVGGDEIHPQDIISHNIER